MEELKLEFIFDIFRKNKQLLTVTFLVSLLLSLIILAFLEPKYSMNTSIIIEENDDSMNFSPETMLLGGQSQKISNEIEIIKSRKILDSVIMDLNLSYSVKKHYNFLINYYLNLLTGCRTVQGSFNIASISGTISGKNFDVTVTQAGYEVYFKGSVYLCEFEKECQINDGKVLIKKLGDIDTGTSFSVDFVPFVKTRQDLLDSLEITPLGDSKNSNVFEIRTISPDPFKTQIILELINKKYIATKVGWKAGDADEQQKFLQKTLMDIKKDLTYKSNELAKYQKNNQTVMPDLQFTEIMKRNIEIEKDIAILKLQLEIVTKYNDSINVADISPVPAPVVIDDISIQMTVKTHNELVAKHAALSVNLTDNHPSLIQSKSDIRQARTALKELLQKSADNYSKSINILKNQSDLIFSTIENLPKNLMNIADLQREVLITEKLYAFLAQKFYEAGINLEMEMSTIRILDDPTPVVHKFSPKLSTSLLMILFISLFISLSSTLTIEFLKKETNSANDVISILKLPYVITSNKKHQGLMQLITDIVAVFPENSRKTCVYYLIPDFEIFTDPNNTFEKFIFFNVLKQNTNLPGLNETKSIKIDHINSFFYSGFNQYLINKKINNMIATINDKQIILLTSIENDVFDSSMFKIFDSFIIIINSKGCPVNKLTKIKAAIDAFGSEHISTIIVND